MPLHGELRHRGVVQGHEVHLGGTEGRPDAGHQPINQRRGLVAGPQPAGDVADGRPQPGLGPPLLGLAVEPPDQGADPGDEHVRDRGLGEDRGPVQLREGVPVEANRVGHPKKISGVSPV